MSAPLASVAGSTNPGSPPRFLTVPQAARLVGTAPVTLYRAIRDGEFPALRIRGRLIVPARAIEAMIEAAISEQGVVDVAEWVADDAPRRVPAPRAAAAHGGER